MKALIVGGSRGLGLSILNEIIDDYSYVDILDVVPPKTSKDKVKFIKADLSKHFDIKTIDFKSYDALIITAGIGTVKPFDKIEDVEIRKLFEVNVLSISRILECFYDNLLNKPNTKCFVMGSIAGEVASPLFSVYGSTKSALHSLCESLNIELEMSGSKNRITYGSAVSFKGSSFNGKETDLNLLKPFAKKCVYAMNNSDTLVRFDPELEKNIIERYQADPIRFGKESYLYKIQNKRINEQKTIVVGYLSGTFDLFHVGHLNLLRRAKEQCDYLIVGVHKSGSWKGKETFIPFEERVEILKAIMYVDEVHESTDEDSDAWELYHYDKLFVGSDYKGTERFNNYERYFGDKGVEIVYFPYTKSTSSTQLREKIKDTN